MKCTPQKPIYTRLLIELYFYRTEAPEDAMTFRIPNSRRGGPHGPAVLMTAAGPASRGTLPGPF